jgi:hypothetical protein
MNSGRRVFGTGLVAFGLLLGQATAQVDDPRQKVLEISKRIAEEMAEIDRLLLQGSGEALRAAREAAQRNQKLLDELLKQTQQSQGNVVKSIDELIQEIERLSQPSGGQGGEPHPQDQQDQQPQGEQQQRQGQRDQTQTPDFQQQQRPQQPGRQRPQGEQPTGPEEHRGPGQQRPATQEPRSDSERVGHEQDATSWGMLPKYVPLLHGRGTMPEVPEKYRRFVEAFTKQAAKGERK